MNSVRPEPALRSTKGDEVSLSGPALTELLRDVLGKGVPFTFRATGVSMFPFIRDGDRVTVSPLLGAAPRHGDVVACIAPGGQSVVIHRVVGRKGGSYLTRGDATSNVDGLVQRRHMLGRVSKVERDGKEVFLGLGRERVLIAVLTRSGLLSRFVFPLGRFLRLIRERLGT